MTTAPFSKEKEKREREGEKFIIINNSNQLNRTWNDYKRKENELEVLFNVNKTTF